MVLDTDEANVIMARMQLKLTWAAFIEAALEHLSSKHLAIALNREDNVRFVKYNSYEGELDVFETPDHVYIDLEDGR